MADLRDQGGTARPRLAVQPLQSPSRNRTAKLDRARRTLRSIDGQAAKAGRALAGKTR